MEHLFASRVDVLRLDGSSADGVPSYDWIAKHRRMLCRLDLSFLRPGKDVLPPIEAGRAPDRIGVAFFSVGADVRPGDRLRCVSGPVTGTFEVSVNPDVAVAYLTGHHLEVQVREVAQQVLS